MFGIWFGLSIVTLLTLNFFVGLECFSAVWEQLMAVGRMMRPAVKLPKDVVEDGVLSAAQQQLSPS